MNKNLYKTIWAVVQITFLILPMVLCIWYVPYKISHDQHMVDTVNERAFDYNGNSTLTDFTEDGIMTRDAQLDYEERAWKLEHQELYYFNAIMFGSLCTVMLQLFNYGWFSIYREMYSERKDDDEFDFDDDY